MIRRLAALILLNTLSLLQTAEGPPQVSCALLELGDNLTLSCPVLQKESGLLYWYKLKFGYMLETVAAGTLDQIKLLEQMDKSRFSVTKRNARPVLDIRNVSKEDEGTYFCQAGTAYQMKFINGTLLAVNGKNQERSFYVKQSPLTESVQPGDSVTLQCSLVSRNKEDRVQCPGEHSVHWFRSGSGESHTGFIHTHSDAQEERSCDFSLSKTIHNSSDTGTYYCAVATCGKIHFRL
uniref:Ig-like domain-containing protein n=1 Tax=Cyclopterus lumpus TaxID=8103 RepID=A0A8C3A8H1_CYCLU